MHLKASHTRTCYCWCRAQESHAQSSTSELKLIFTTARQPIARRPYFTSCACPRIEIVLRHTAAGRQLLLA